MNKTISKLLKRPVALPEFMEKAPEVLHLCVCVCVCVCVCACVCVSVFVWVWVCVCVYCYYRAMDKAEAPEKWLNQ